MSARSALRTATADDHERVDAIFGSFPLGEAAGYRAFLQATATAYLPVEAALDEGGAETVLKDWSARRRGALLRADLAELGLAPDKLEAPRMTGAPPLLGAIYVLEGSRLGGAMLKRSVPAHLPRRFLDAPSGKGAWRALGDLLDDRLRKSQDLADAIVAAKQVFGLFAQAGHIVLEPTK